VFTPVLGERGVIVKGNAIFTLVTRAHFCRAVMMWGGSIRENEFLSFGSYGSLAASQEKPVLLLSLNDIELLCLF